MFCSNCGRKLQDGQNFCPVCGTSMNTAPNQNATNNQNENGYNPPNQGSIYSQNNGYYNAPNQAYFVEMETPKKKFNKLFLIPIIGVPILAIILCLVLFTNTFGGGPKATAEKYLDSIANKDVDAFAECVMPKEVREELLEDKLDGDEKKLNKRMKKLLKQFDKNLEDKMDFDLDESYSLKRIGTFTNKSKKGLIKGFDEVSKEDLKCTEGVFYRIEQDGAKKIIVAAAKINGHWYAMGPLEEKEIKDNDINRD